jgi:hypothetical protein
MVNSFEIGSELGFLLATNDRPKKWLPGEIAEPRRPVQDVNSARKPADVADIGKLWCSTIVRF